MKKTCTTSLFILTFAIANFTSIAQDTTKSTSPNAIKPAAPAEPAAAAPVAAASVTVKEAPPEMPVYEQPVCPAAGHIWTPGYWAYGAGGYFWVPGVWVAAPQPGLYWTPNYWGYENGYYGYHEGYWGPTIGYYGGINYGYGYGGEGYYGGRYEGNEFRYNSAVSHVDRKLAKASYEDKSVISKAPPARFSYNGPGGYTKQPSSAELAAAKNPGIVKPTADQQSHFSAASSDKSQLYSANKGHPTKTTATKIDSHPSGAKTTSPAPGKTTGAPAPGKTTGAPAPAKKAAPASSAPAKKK